MCILARSRHSLAWQNSVDYFQSRGEGWQEVRLPFFDYAFNQALRPSESAANDVEMVRGAVPDDDHRIVTGGYTGPGTRVSAAHNNEIEARTAFLGFFVSVLKEYRRFVVYSSEVTCMSTIAWARVEFDHFASIQLKNTKHSHFRADEFLNNQPADYVPFVRALLRTQAFHCFIDERVYGDPEVL